MTPDLVIFDCDGVLIDSEAIACVVDAEELTAAGYPISTAQVIRRFSGTPAQQMLDIIECEWGRKLPPDFGERVEARVLARYRQELQPIRGAAETLAQLPWRFSVASSSKPSKLALGLVETGLFDLLYPHIYSTALVSKGKPAPDLFLLAAHRMGAEPRHCVVIEDSIAGVTAARRAGMRALGFTGGSHCAEGHADDLRKAGAELIFSEFAELLALITLLPQISPAASNVPHAEVAAKRPSKHPSG